MSTTAPALESYVSGRWQSGTDEGTTLTDAVTGNPVARVSSTGVDTAAAVRWGREVGGPALRALPFAERAALVKAVATVLGEAREELYELSARTGATRRDSAVDIDGGIGTLAVYASKGRKELPEGDVLLDGDIEPLGRGGTFAGRHLYRSRLGVAVQINAFNFPVWGPAEKFAPALLAGVPTIIKPATPTAYLTELMVRRVIESGVLPEGALQLVCGSARQLLDELDGQDSVWFTGSADTAAALRRHPAVTERSARFNAEADSLNASVLGPDAVAGTPEFDLYVDQLVTEMTVKAGQKCTAIRRAFVPAAAADDVVEAVRSRLAEVVVGSPADERSVMGALVSHEQRDSVREAVARLAGAGGIVYGNPASIDVVGADDTTGAFLSPLLLRCDDTDRPEPHDIEAFGPVSTVLPYTGTADVVDQLARGGGSLVASVVSEDAAFQRDVVLGAGAHHGRMLLLDRHSAAENTGHGIPMPQLVHGGPGRAGGGEEEGGLRAVLHHMQRVAIQGSPALLESFAPGPRP
ncbi:phenylacetic acid degradation bifunctional protein PaaZ [Modestobacter lapidis]|nr:phenylacetic acid degradation bifunctional protein PaaZ [Modestobacter lapidis]